LTPHSSLLTPSSLRGGVMAATRRRAVITGLGLLTCAGSTPEAFWQSLAAGRSGIKPISTFDISGLPVRFAGEIADFDAKKYIVDKAARTSLRVMARTIQLAVSAAQLALDHGKVDKSKLDPTRFGVEFGAGLNSTPKRVG